MSGSMTQEVAQSVRALPQFRDLSEIEFAQLAAAMKMRHYERRAIIVRQGEPSQDFYFLVSGFIKMSRGGPMSQIHQERESRGQPRKEVALAVLGPGQMFGAIAALVEGTRSATVTALSDCVLVQMPHALFSQCMQRHQGFALEISRHLALRLVEANHQIELLRADTRARLAALMRHFQQIGLPEEVFPSNAEIGRMVGVSREMVSKLRSQLKSDAAAASGLTA